jgi:diguanylate cyclase (GGDEF)-like protein/PAS domain S-box-containing protein
MSNKGQSPQNILLIQDDATDARSVYDALMSCGDGPFVVEWVRRCSEGIKRLARAKDSQLASNAIAAVMLDLYLADSQGIATFERVFEAAPKVPILVLVAADGAQIAEVAVQRGAQDFLLKGRIDNYWLPKALRSMVERASIANALFEEKERADVTLNSIGDAVMSTDEWCNITYLNVVAEALTGWSRTEAAGHPVEQIFRIVDGDSREVVGNPMALAIRENRTVGLTPNCILVRRDGVEAAIEDSAAPIHNRQGEVTGAVMVFHDVSTARAVSQRMSYLAQHDGLTDLPNRIMLNDRLAQALAMARRHPHKLALLFLDLDRFKHINDSLGHGVGDLLLRSVAQRLLGRVRSSDTVSRQGGDEFVILLSEVAHAEDAGITAENILRALDQPHLLDGHEIHITGSIGIVTFPDDAADADALLKCADLAMYQAKATGRNNYQFFKSALNVSALEHQSIEHGLRQALERAEFVLHYQPQMNLATGVIAGVEALLRWRHPTRGLLCPVDFMPVAEESGLIVPIGRWVLREACRQARVWDLSGLAPIRMAVNVSAVELRSKLFAEGVNAVLTETGMVPGNLELELTETFLMQDSSPTVTVLQALKGSGIQLALDDFGTGYSSLSYMRRFPIDTLKIDQSFVRDLTTDANDASIVSAVITMGHSLHMLVVAEGVETAEQAMMLREQACPEGQGYYFGPPVTAEAISTLRAPGARES